MRSAFTSSLIFFSFINIINFSNSQAQIFCDPNGNVILYSNYDGGYLNINIDQNIPNLKIGITTYEDCEVTISGPYVSNVTEVIYAGFQGDNQHCNPSPLTTSVNGVAANLVTVWQNPPVTWNNPNGWDYGIICNYSCDSAYSQGGCNTPDQIAHYFLTEFSGLLYYHYTQYGCWVGTYNASSGGNCCIGAYIIPSQFNLIADFEASSDTVCAEQGILFTDNSTNTYPGATSYNWDFGDGTSDTSANTSHGYTSTGSYVVTLTVTEGSGVVSDTETIIITVIDCGPTGFNSSPSQKVFIHPNPLSDLMSVSIPDFIQTPAELEVIDVCGRIHLKHLLRTSGSHDFSVKDVPRGLYFVRVKGENYSGQIKVLKE